MSRRKGTSDCMGQNRPYKLPSSGSAGSRWHYQLAKESEMGQAAVSEFGPPYSGLVRAISSIVSAHDDAPPNVIHTIDHSLVTNEDAHGICNVSCSVKISKQRNSLSLVPKQASWNNRSLSNICLIFSHLRRHIEPQSTSVWSHLFYVRLTPRRRSSDVAERLDCNVQIWLTAGVEKAD